MHFGPSDHKFQKLKHESNIHNLEVFTTSKALSNACHNLENLQTQG
jgi:5'(3')-deoxyribonucleotidase